MYDFKRCPFCGAKIDNESISLHIWEIKYECGTVIWGGIGSDEYKIEEKCQIKNHINIS